MPVAPSFAHLSLRLLPPPLFLGISCSKEEAWHTTHHGRHASLAGPRDIALVELEGTGGKVHLVPGTSN